MEVSGFGQETWTCSDNAPGRCLTPIPAAVQDRRQSARGVLAINRPQPAEARHLKLRPVAVGDRSQASARGVLAIDRPQPAEARHLKLRPVAVGDRSQASARGVLAIDRPQPAEARHLGVSAVAAQSGGYFFRYSKNACEFRSRPRKSLTICWGGFCAPSASTEAR